jgi:hypothetical protein
MVAHYRQAANRERNARDYPDGVQGGATVTRVLAEFAFCLLIAAGLVAFVALAAYFSTGIAP